MKRSARCEVKNPVAPPELDQRIATNHIDGDIASLIREGPEGFREWISFDGLGSGLGVWVVENTKKLRLASNPIEFGCDGVDNTVFWIDPHTYSSLMFFTQVIPFNRFMLRFEMHRLVVHTFN